MGKRREFSTSARLAMIQRATRDLSVYCELCDLPCTKWEYHHIIEEELVVDKSAKLTSDDGLLICEPCHDDITATQSIPRVAKAKRREARHLGAHRPKGSIKGPGFDRKERAHAGRPALPPRGMFK